MSLDTFTLIPVVLYRGFASRALKRGLFLLKKLARHGILFPLLVSRSSFRPSSRAGALLINNVPAARVEFAGSAVASAKMKRKEQRREREKIFTARQREAFNEASRRTAASNWDQLVRPCETQPVLLSSLSGASLVTSAKIRRSIAAVPAIKRGELIPRSALPVEGNRPLPIEKKPRDVPDCQTF